MLISVLVTRTHGNRQIAWVKGTEYMKTSRGAKARECSCTCFIYFVSRQVFFSSFSRATSLFGFGRGAQSSVVGKLDNFFILLSPPDNFLEPHYYEVDLFNNFITGRIAHARKLLCSYFCLALRF